MLMARSTVWSRSDIERSNSIERPDSIGSYSLIQRLQVIKINVDIFVKNISQ